MIPIITFLFFSLLGFIVIRKVNIELFVFLFILLLPMRGLSPEQADFLGRISPDNIATGILFILLLSRKSNSFKLKNIDYSKKIEIFILLFFLIGVHYYIKIKDLLLVGATAYGLPPEGIKLYQVIRDIIIIFTFILLSEKLYSYKILLSINKAIVYSSIIISLSIIFPEIVPKYGLVGGFSVYNRQSGLLNVNPNIAGSYCTIIIGYILALFGYRREILKGLNKTVLIITGALLFIAILFTGSRQAILTVLIIFLLFFYVNKKVMFKNINIVYVIGLIFLFIIFYENQGQLMQERIVESIEKEGGSLQSRIQHWTFYLNDLIKNPKYILFGNTKPLPYSYRYNPHNLYIFLLWNAGGMILGLLVYYLFKLYKKNSNNMLNYYAFDIRFCLVAFIITSIVNSFVLNYTLIAIILISAGIPSIYIYTNYNKPSLVQ